MSGNTAPQRWTFVEGEIRLCSVAFAGQLDTGELLKGTPTVTEVSTSDLTLSNKVVNTAELTMLGETYAIGEAVQFLATGQLASQGSYTIKITCGTDSTPAQTLIGLVEFDVE